MGKPPPNIPAKGRPSLIDQMHPDYGYDENGMWCGMTKAEVQAFLRQNAIEREQMRLLYHWVPPKVSN